MEVKYTWVFNLSSIIQPPNKYINFIPSNSDFKANTVTSVDNLTYRQNFKMRRNLIGNKNFDHSDVPVGAAPTASLFST